MERAVDTLWAKSKYLMSKIGKGYKASYNHKKDTIFVTLVTATSFLSLQKFLPGVQLLKPLKAAGVGFHPTNNAKVLDGLYHQYILSHTPFSEAVYLPADYEVISPGGISHLETASDRVVTEVLKGKHYLSYEQVNGWVTQNITDVDPILLCLSSALYEMEGKKEQSYVRYALAQLRFILDVQKCEHFNENIDLSLAWCREKVQTFLGDQFEGWYINMPEFEPLKKAVLLSSKLSGSYTPTWVCQQGWARSEGFVAQEQWSEQESALFEALKGAKSLTQLEDDVAGWVRL
ncbi:hypothetical protein [Candidatus Synchoanobacter obligatus]|uniref:Uncharacterized protein n=1 Tax=Candidatus Synchoanobacter obligatus TaxID=2919597 RepID=A0ABT1L6A6_9GAMM|nr:hypothetical protein [Candidatus Synchoanobacter obligatus]MCP8352433.1 hypothetical protein [Candidatus Synchoanobacter obligatus]